MIGLRLERCLVGLFLGMLVGGCGEVLPDVDLNGPAKGKADTGDGTNVETITDADSAWMEETSLTGQTTIRPPDGEKITVDTLVLGIEPARKTRMTLRVERAPDGVGKRAPALRFSIYYKKRDCGCDSWRPVTWIDNQRLDLAGEKAGIVECAASMAFRSIHTGTPERDELTAEIGLPCSGVVEEKVLPLEDLPGVDRPEQYTFSVFVFPADTEKEKAEIGVGYGYTLHVSCDGEPCI